MDSGEGSGREIAGRTGIVVKQTNNYQQERNKRQAGAPEGVEDNIINLRNEVNDIGLSDDSHEANRAAGPAGAHGQNEDAIFSPNRANIQSSQNDRRAAASLSRKLQQSKIPKSSEGNSGEHAKGVTSPNLLRNEAHESQAMARAHVQSTSPVHSSHQIKTAFQAKDGINVKSRQAQIGDQSSVERLGRGASRQGGVVGVQSFSSTQRAGIFNGTGATPASRAQAKSRGAAVQSISGTMSPNFASIKSKELKLFASNRSNNNKMGLSHVPGLAAQPGALGQSAAARQRTPRALKDNLFLQELKFIRCPLNSVSQKYHILYDVLAPKLMQRESLADSKVQKDAVEVLQYLVAGDPVAGEQPQDMMPLLDSSLPLMQDIIYMLARYVPGGLAAQRKKSNFDSADNMNMQQARRALPLGVYTGQAPQQ